jgi:hypothetical protein
MCALSGRIVLISRTGVSIWISHAVLSAGLQSKSQMVVQIVAGGFLKVQQASAASR